MSQLSGNMIFLQVDLVLELFQFIHGTLFWDALWVKRQEINKLLKPCTLLRHNAYLIRGNS